MSDRGALLNSFVEEVHRRCAAITSTVSMVELGQGPPSGLADAALDAHALKGTAGVLELPDIAGRAGELESLLTGAGESPPEPTTIARVNELTAAIEDGARAAAAAEADA